MSEENVIARLTKDEIIDIGEKYFNRNNCISCLLKIEIKKIKKESVIFNITSELLVISMNKTLKTEEMEVPLKFILERYYQKNEKKYYCFP